VGGRESSTGACAAAAASLEIPGGRGEGSLVDREETMSLLRFLGLGGSGAGRDHEPDSLAELTSHLESMEAAEARLAAAFAYLLARVAGSDLRTDETEQAAMAERLETFGALDASTASVLAKAAIRVADHHGGSDDHLVARAFRDMTAPPERLRLLRCLYAVAAADDTITTVEDNEVFEIATALSVSRQDVIAIRSEWKQHLGTLKALPQER